jgi:signal transduction histidine kinase
MPRGADRRPPPGEAAAGAARRRSGLANLEERASELGGTLRTLTAAGGGTELEWRVPLRGQ